MQAMLRFLRVVRYRKGVMIVALAASVLLGGLYYATTPRVYESKASLLVMQTGVGTGMWSPEMTVGRAAQDLMATYMNVLSSDAVVEEAVKLLPPEDRVDLAGAPPANWVGIVQKNLSVNTVRRGNILKIAYRSKEPHAAAAVVDSIVSAYLKFMDKLHKSTAHEILAILTKENAEIEEQLRAKQAELISLRSRAGDGVICDGDNGINVVVRRAISLNESLIAAHEKRLEAQSRLGAIRAAIHNGEDLQQHALAMIDSVGREVILQRLGLSSADTNTISRVNQQLLEDRAELRSKLQIYGAAHRQVQEIQERIQELEQFLRNRHHLENTQLREIDNQELAAMLLQMASQQLEQAVAHEKSVFASYEQEKNMAIGLDHTMAQLEILKLDLNRLRQTQDVVLQRIKDVDLGQDNGSLRTRVLSRPEVPLGPVWPRINVMALLSLAAGLGGGLVIVYLQDLLDDHFRSPEELQTQLGVPVLAMVGRLEPVADHGIDAVHVHVRPNAVEVEAFRTLRTALALAGGGTQRLVVSSSEPSDGKTTVGVNLATVYAQSGKRTLLIDADMRRPGLTPLLDLRGQHGLSTVLREPVPVAETAQTNLYVSVAKNLDVLPSGPRPGNPTELLAGDRFSELLCWAETRYDQIIIDSPPALVSDTAIIGRLVDGVLLVVQPEKNRRRLVIRATESFQNLGINVLGVVINRLTSEKGEDYYGYGYGYGYSSGYGSGYGHEEDASDGAGDFEEPVHPSTTAIRRVA